MITSDELRSLLHDSVVKIVFTKKNGSLREMWATLQDAYIETPTYSANAEPDHLVTVWDMQKSDWRRVITSKIESFEVFSGDHEVPALEGEEA